MQLVEQHVIDKADPRFAVIDAAAFAAKNLYRKWERRAPDLQSGEEWPPAGVLAWAVCLWETGSKIDVLIQKRKQLDA